jgi:1-acyl-sn-glycerol-3-phosphate acyltransferase
MILSKLRALFTALQFTITVSVVIILMYIFRDNNYRIRNLWARMQLKLMGVKLEIKGEMDKNAQMYIMNHQSILDIVLYEAIAKRNLAWVAKKEIADIPWFGNILKAPRMIIVERENKTSLVKLLKDAKNRLDNGRPIVIFPEGTRSDGNKLRKFKAGARMIADKNKLLVQPMIVVGTRKIFDSQNFNQRSGTVKVIYLPSVQAQKGTNWFEEAENQMRETLKKENIRGI